MNNSRKLLHRDKVEVRQLEEGLRGAWHSGVVVGVADSCRNVRYDELLSESGRSKLVESIPITGAIEGLYQRPCVKSNYRGRIRPIPPCKGACSLDSGLKFGVCVDVLYKEAWWEGVIFDCDDAAKERRVYFPDEGDLRVCKLSDIRLTYEWDEFSGIWRDRGTWLLVNLAREHKKAGNLFQLVRRVWSHLRVHYGYRKMISEWTCGAYCVWKQYFQEVISEITAKRRAKTLVFPNITHRHVAKQRGSGLKRGSYLNGSALTRSMKRRNDKIIILAVRTRRMCMNDNDNFLISAATKGSHLADLRRRQTHSMTTDTCRTNESQKAELRGEYEKGEFPHGRTGQNGNLCASPCSHGNNSKMPVKPRFRRKWHYVERSLTPRSLKPSKIIRHHLKRRTCDGLTTRYTVHRQGERRLISIRSIRKKKSPLRIRKINSRTCKENKDKSNPALSKEFEAAKSSRKEADVLGSHCENMIPVADSCQNIRSEEALNSPGNHGARSSRYHDSVCFICQYGDDLLHCDLCLSSYHLPCVDVEGAASAGLFCPSCRCGLCGLRGFASDDQLFSDVCYQCSRQYHLTCLKQAGMSVAEDNRFCSKSCFEICAHLHQLLRISNPTSVEGLTWTITRSRRNDCNVCNERAHPLIQVSRALNVLRECFQPIIEPHAGRDLVADIVYNSGSKIRRLDFHGFYVMALVNDDEIVCAATIRIHGQKVAEMPLIATPFKYRRQGMCRLLLHGLEKMLVELGVERLVLPGIATLSDTWVSSFGFTEMPASVRRELLGYPFVVFQGTTMFHKVLDRSSEGPGNAKSRTTRSMKSNDGATSSSSGCGMQQIDTTERVLRSTTGTYSRRNKCNREFPNFKLRTDLKGSLEDSVKLGKSHLEWSQENCSKNEPKRLSLCSKKNKQSVFTDRKAVMDETTKNQPTFKCMHKRRRIQASKDSSDC